MYVQMQSRDTNVDEKHCKTIDNDKMYEGFIKIVLTVILYNGYKCFFKGNTYSKYSYQHLKNPSNVAWIVVKYNYHDLFMNIKLKLHIETPFRDLIRRKYVEWRNILDLIKNENKFLTVG